MEAGSVGSTSISTMMVGKAIKTQETAAQQLMGLLDSSSVQENTQPSPSASITKRGQSLDVQG